MMNKNPLSIFCLTILLSASVQAAETEAEHDYVYIFGYGSLMLTLSRTATAPDPTDVVYLPTKIKGMGRRWNLWSKKNSSRVLGLEKSDNKNAFVNGLLFPVKREKLSDYDRREGITAYQRTKVSIDDIQFYRESHRSQIMANGKQPEIFTYVAIPHSPFYVTKDKTDKPIATYYLDIVRAGCIEVDRTHQLNGHFINDCVQTMVLKDYVIHDDSASRNYPTALLEQARTKVVELEQFLKNDWPKYQDAIHENWKK